MKEEIDVRTNPNILNTTLKDMFLKIIKIYSIYLILVGLCIGFSILVPGMFKFDNIINILRVSSIVGLLAIGQTFVIVGGGIDLSIGSILALSGVLAAGLLGSLPLSLALIVALSVGAFIGFCNGFTITKLGLQPFVATLGFMGIASGLAFIYTNGRPIIIDNDFFQYLGIGYLGIVPVPIVIFAVACIIAHFLLSSTVYGRRIYSTGGNEEATRLSGISTVRVRIYTYVLSGALAALAGIIMAGRLASATPMAGSGNYMMDSIAAAIVGGTSLTGGRGTIIGTIAGVLIISVLSNGLNMLNVVSYWQDVVKGFIIIAAVASDVYMNSRSR